MLFLSYFLEENCVQLHRLNFIKPVEIKKDQRVEVIIGSDQKASSIDFQVMYRYTPDEVWTQTASGSLQKVIFDKKNGDIKAQKESLEEMKDSIRFI